MRLHKTQLTLELRGAVNLGDLLLNQLVTLLADGYNLLASNAQLRHSSKDLLADSRCGLVLGENVGGS